MENRTDTYITKLHVPIFIYISLLFLFGLITNCFILYIYHFRMKKTIFSFFVQILAMVDMSTVLVSLPGSFVFRLYSHTLDNSRMCKFLIFMNHFNALSAGFLFSVIAIQRYRKVCHPHGRQITRFLAMKLCMGVMCLAFALSVPIVFIVGVADTPVVIDNYTSIVPLCDYEPYLKGNGQSVIYAILVDMEFLGITCLLTAVYTNIGKSLKTRMRANERRNANTFSGSATTKVFFILTIVFILSVLPLMIISTLFSFFRFPPTLTLTTQILVDFGVYLPYVNCIVNPIIYSFTSRVFRTELLSVCQLNRKLKKNTKTSGRETETTPQSQTETTSL